MPTKPLTCPSLKLLAEAKADGVSKVTTFRVDPDLVAFEEGFNVRTEDQSLLDHQERLYTAIKNGASLPPIDVRVDAGTIICVEGHSRTIAARRWKKEFPEYTLEARQFRGDEKERVMHMLGTGNGQKPLTPLENGIAFLRLVKWGMTPQQIADLLHISRPTVDNCLTLAEAPIEVQQLVRDGAVSSTTAREAIKQGSAGVEALKAAAQAELPLDGASKKKKVTAKTLKGTPAAKPAKKARKKKSECGPGEFVVKLEKEGAETALAIIKDYGRENDESLNTFIATIELALM